MKGSRHRLRRTVTACLAFSLYGAGGIAAPVVHSETEVLQGTVGIERGHSSTCPRVHSEVACVMASAYQLPGGGTAPAEEPALGERGARPAPADGPRQSSSRSFGFVRAPPAA